jgi:uncharacterized protein with von Willebrand factor type A (vWA) domain
VSISFEKLERQAPELVSLAKKAQFNLSRHDLEDQRAKVALCLDHSGSMRQPPCRRTAHRQARAAHLSRPRRAPAAARPAPGGRPA